MRPFRLTVLSFIICLQYASAQITLNPLPTRVIGQLSTTLNSTSPNLVEGREFQSPESVVVDTTSSPFPVYVADTGNNRILGFRNSTGFTNGQFADIVIGQPDFFTTLQQGGTNSSRTTGLTAPEGMAVDKTGNLYVVDAGNNRVLRFPKPFGQTATVFPDLAIGQPGFATGNPNHGGLSASSLSFSAPNTSVTIPASLTFDAAGNLWVADAGNNRILRFNASVLGSQAASGPAADIVLGQADFVTNLTTTTPPLTSLTAIQAPTGIVFDGLGNLFVSESVSGRIGRVLVWFGPPAGPAFSTGEPATRMLGVDQNNPSLPNQHQFATSPLALFTVGNGPASQVGVADTYNNRLLLFLPVTQWNQNLFYQSAVTVIGQTDYSTGSFNQGLPSAGASTLGLPVGAFFFNSSLYVSDAANNRVLVIPQNGSTFGPASTVLGQLQLTLNAANLINGREFNFSSSGGDAGITVDFTSAVPHLYVSDPGNNRVLGFYDLRNIQPGQFADIVIGQPDFLHSVSNYPNNQPTSGNLSLPTGLAVDSAGNLYVADSGNGRVLRFHAPFANFQPGTPFALTESADLLLGQIGYTTKITDATSQTMGSPYGLAFDGDNGLLVSDLAHNRVLFFAGKAANLTSSQAASIVFGQPDMNSSAPGSGLNQLNSPRHIAVDSDERLYVADSSNARVSIFNRVSAANNGVFAAAALTVGLRSPRGVDVNQATGDIWVADAVANTAFRYPSFNNLIAANYSPNATLSDFGPLAVAEDNYGNLFVADDASRVLIYYPGLSVLNAGNFLSQTSVPENFPMAPGVIAAVYSTGTTGQFGSGSASAATVPLPKRLNGVQVLVNGTPAALFYAGQNQINFEFPSNAPTSGLTDVQVLETATGRVLGDTSVYMQPVSPGIFTQNANGIGDGIIANLDGTLNTSKNPATAGTIVTIYMTGQGFITGMPADGDISNKALSTPYTPTVYVGGTGPVPPENIQYSGLAPTLVGVWQINVKIPADVVSLPANPVQVFVQVDSVLSGGKGIGRPVYIYIKAP